MRHPLLPSLFALASLGGLAAAQNGFIPEEVYVVTTHAAGTFATNVPGILRVSGGASAQVASLTNVAGSAHYDPYRKKIVFAGIAAGAGIPTLSMIAYSPLTGLEKIDLGGLTARTLAPTADGRIYFMDASSGTAEPLYYVDAAGVVHTVLNATGTGPFKKSAVAEMIYDPVTQSIFLNRGAISCGTALNVPEVTKVPLTPDGTQVAGPTTAFNICGIPNPGVSTDNWEAEQFSYGPNGTIAFAWDNNQNLKLGRMIVFDPVTLAYSIWAQNDYAGSGATDGGFYHAASNSFRILDTFNNVLRAFAQGESGAGTVVATGISSTASGTETTSAVLIPPPSVAGIANYGTGTPGCLGPQQLFANGIPKIGNGAFQVHTSRAPVGALGLALVGTVPDAPGADAFGLGFLVHVDLFASTELFGLDATSGPAGIGVVAAPLPNDAGLVGKSYDVQTIWAWSGCTPPAWSGLSSSDGLSITIQP